MRKNKSAVLRKLDILESYYQILVQKGLEGASIGRIAENIDIHPSLIIHYFKNKQNMKLELVNLLMEKYKSPSMFDMEPYGRTLCSFRLLLSQPASGRGDGPFQGDVQMAARLSQP